MEKYITISGVQINLKTLKGKSKADFIKMFNGRVPFNPERVWSKIEPLIKSDGSTNKRPAKRKKTIRKPSNEGVVQG